MMFLFDLLPIELLEHIGRHRHSTRTHTARLIQRAVRESLLIPPLVYESDFDSDEETTLSNVHTHTVSEIPVLTVQQRGAIHVHSMIYMS